jgi:hypothetical protein
MRLLDHSALERGRRPPGFWLRLAALVAAAAMLVANAALGSSGSSSDVLTLQQSIAGHSRDLAQLLDRTNAQMTLVERDMAVIGGLDGRMRTIAGRTQDLNEATGQLGGRLGGVRAKVRAQGHALRLISRQVSGLSTRMQTVDAAVASQLALTRGMSQNFSTVSSRMTGMTGDFRSLIREMGLSLPKVSQFSTNELQTSYPGGDSAKYGELNLAPDTRVMSIMLPMIATLQSGGDLIGDKVSQTADSTLVGGLLSASVPDGTNVVSKVRPYDGRYGLPPANWFLRHRVGGF